MIKVRKIAYVLVFTVLPTGCGDPGAPSAPSAPSASAADAGTYTPPKAERKGRKLVSPGGQRAAEP